MVSRAFNQGFWLLTLYIEKQLNIYLDTLINCMNLFFLCLPMQMFTQWQAGCAEDCRCLQGPKKQFDSIAQVSHRGPQLSDMLKGQNWVPSGNLT